MINQYDFLKELKMCLHKLSLMDDTLEAVGLPKKYQRLRKWLIRIIIGCIVLMFCQYAFALMFDDSYTSITVKTLVEIILELIFPEFIYISSTLIWGTIFGLVYM